MKVRTVNAIAIAIEVIGVLIGYELLFVAGHHTLAWVLLVIWLVGCQQAENFFIRRRKVQLAAMWLKAEQLGFGGDALAGLAPKYDANLWNMTKPDRLLFLPSPLIVGNLTNRLQAQLDKRNKQYGLNEAD